MLSQSCRFDDGLRWSCPSSADYARVGDVDKARELLQLSERVGNMADVINKTDRFGWTAMHWACESSPENTSMIQRERKLAIVKTLCKEYRSEPLSLSTPSSPTFMYSSEPPAPSCSPVIITINILHFLHSQIISTSI